MEINNDSNLETIKHIWNNISKIKINKIDAETILNNFGSEILNEAEWAIENYLISNEDTIIKHLNNEKEL